MILTPQQQLAIGWDIFPMLPGEKTSFAHFDENGDTQATKWVDGWERLTEADVDRYWPYDGAHNIGVATGRRSGVWVLDIDIPFETELEAREHFAEMTGIEIPQTLSVQTASGKWHFYFKMPEISSVQVKTTRSVLAPNVDVRGDGGMAMGIGSTAPGPDGLGQYHVVTWMAPVFAPLELLERVRKEEREQPVAEASTEKAVDEMADQIAAPWIEAELQRLRDLPRPWAPGSGWHDTCFQVACNLNEFANSPWCSLTPDAAMQAYFDAAPKPEPKWNPIMEWREGVKKTQGQGRMKPMTAADLGWFNDIGTSSPSAPRPEQQPVSAGEAPQALEPIGPPRTWGVEINQTQESGATFMLAAEIRRCIPNYDGVPILASYQGVWHYWDASAWIEASSKEIFDVVARNIALVRVVEPGKDGEPDKLKPLSPTTSKVEDVEKALASLLRRPDDAADDVDGVYTTNGVVSLMPGDRSIVPASPRTFNLSALSFAYDATAACPQWENFLANLFEHDPAAIEALQEWFGYFLNGDPSWLQKMFWLIGPPRSGKGTILRVARALLGDAATATTLTTLSKDFGRENLVGKRLAIIDDARDPDPRLAHSVTEFLLTLSSGGFISIARKHRRSWDGILSSSLLAASNTIPRLPDEGAAVSGRLEVIRTRKSYIGHEDAHLADRLLTELPGILNWALVGLDRLRAQERFTQSLASAAVRDQVDKGATGATPMVEELLMEHNTFGLKKQDLRFAAQWWAQQQEDDWRPSAPSIRSAIQARFPDAMDLQRIETPSGEKVNKGWRGITLRCREADCENPATRATQISGPECALHLTTSDLRAVSNMGF